MDVPSLLQTLNEAYDKRFGPLTDLLAAAWARRLISREEMKACLCHIRDNPVRLKSVENKFGSPVELAWGEFDPNETAAWENLFSEFLDKA